jgi:hypothetical protein
MVANHKSGGHQTQLNRRSRHRRMRRSTRKLTRREMLGAILAVALLQVTDAAAQSVPLLGYAVAKDVNPRRLAVFKEALAALGYIEPQPKLPPQSRS